MNPVKKVDSLVSIFVEVAKNAAILITLQQEVQAFEGENELGQVQLRLMRLEWVVLELVDG